MSLLSSMPAPDQRLSPITGWTRDHWLHCADSLLAGAQRHSSPGHARVRFPSVRSPDAGEELEGFARTFLLGALRIAAGGSQRDELLSWYEAALDAGSDPTHPDAWPAITDHDQTLVEATAIALALHWSREWLWPALPSRVQERLVGWLSGGRGRRCADNNHVLFGATVEAFLASVDADHDPGAIEAVLSRTEDFYLGDDWYSDGPGRRLDHYNAWTFHLYPFFIGEMLGGGALPADFDHYRSRLGMFCADYQQLFNTSGSPVLQGRSLTYRWGVVAPFWMAARYDCSPLAAGQTRRLASGVLRHFVSHGVGQDQVLGLGWHRHSASVFQSYNSAGLPYWASKGFLGLLLPADHPVWTDLEQPQALDEHDIAIPLAAPGWLVVGTHRDGVVRLLNHGSDGHPQHDDRWYRRLAFSSRTAPIEIDGIRDNVIDVPVGHRPARHRGLRAGRVGATGASCAYALDASGRDIRVDVATTVFGGLELRMARFCGVVGLPVRVSGYPVASSSTLPTETGPTYAAVSSPEGLTSALGIVECSVASVIQPRVVSSTSARPGVDSPFGDVVGLPYAELDRADHDEVRIAWWVILTGSSDIDVAQLPVVVRWLDDGVEVRFGGEHRRLGWTREHRWPADRLNQGVFNPSARLTMTDLAASAAESTWESNGKGRPQ